MTKNVFLRLCLLGLLVLPAACKEEKVAEIKPDDPVAMRAILPGEEKLPYHASSDIDGWQLSVMENQIIFERINDKTSIVLPKPNMELLTGGYQYRLPTTPKVTTVVVKHVECKDSAGNSFPDTVEIDDASGKTQGCGVPVGQAVATPQAASPSTAAPVLEDIEWRAVSIHGNPVTPEAGVTLKFDREGKLSGKGGCNRYSGSYTIKESSLSIGEGIAATKMACMGEGGKIEDSYFAALQQVAGYRFGQDGALVLTDKDGKDILQFTP